MPHTKRARLGPWARFAACRIPDNATEEEARRIANLFHPRGQSGPGGHDVYNRLLAQATAICDRCPAKAACLSYALDPTNRIHSGVWGGIDMESSGAARRRRPRPLGE